MLNSLYYLNNFYSFNPDFAHEDHPVLNIYDNMREKLYNQVIWVSMPFMLYALYNSLFITSSTVLGFVGASRVPIERTILLQGFLSFVYYLFYKDTKGLGELKDEWVNIFFTSLVSAVPLAGLEYYHILLS